MTSRRRCIGAGFYYKTFMGPDWFGKNWAWTRVYEPAIRLAAGLGAAPREPDPDRYARYFDHCDVLIVGAGPAGLAAALAAGGSGARVVRLRREPGARRLASCRDAARRSRRKRARLARAYARRSSRRSRTCG